MLSAIICYFLFITLSLASALASTSKIGLGLGLDHKALASVPRPRPQGPGLSLGLGLEILASFYLTGFLLCWSFLNVTSKLTTLLPRHNSHNLANTPHLWFNFYRAMLRRARLWDCMSSVCPSVCSSVTLRYVFHTVWNTWKIISQPNSLRSLLTLTPTWAIWCNRFIFYDSRFWSIQKKYVSRHYTIL